MDSDLPDTGAGKQIDAVAGSITNGSSLSVHFRVSTGLKRVLGRELITEDHVAIFELVKNSFDAGARHVYLHFGDNSITIIDDGSGMSYDDLYNKWLFVAYSSKRSVNRDDGKDYYRDQVADRQHFAGSKGIGRFASDRLGRLLVLQTRDAANKLGHVHNLTINWASFEKDDADHFDLVDIAYEATEKFSLPKSITELSHGTVINIRNLTKQWSRTDLLRLKAGLTKLINPFGASTDGFEIYIISESQIEEDEANLLKLAGEPADKSNAAVSLVNGPVKNFIFSTLREKTTFIDVSIKEDIIYTSLTDRGELIYRISEPCNYPDLVNSGFSCQLYYLNPSAKLTFARRMGIPSVQFGSVFLFRNGFRVFPIGEEGNDWFGLDRRKQQGYARFLGSREVIGRIDVLGDEELFQEASSRNQGLIETNAVLQLKRCFWEHCLKRLERYVVPVSWEKTSDKVAVKDDLDDLTFIESDLGRTRVSAAVADLIGSEDIKVLDYSSRIVSILDEHSTQFKSSLASLKVIAANTKNRELSSRIEEAEVRFEELARSEANARRIANEERHAKEQAEQRAATAIADAENVRIELGEERKRNYFLAAASSLDLETLNNLHHQITIYSTNLQHEITGLILRLTRNPSLPADHIVSRLESIALFNQKIGAVARFATKANFRLESEYITEDISDYIASYVKEIASMFLSGNLKLNVNTDNKEGRRKFKPIDVAIVVDNLVSNARKAHATEIIFDLKLTHKNLLELRVTDDGDGVPMAAANENRLFEKGVTTSNGSGLGLYHVKQVLGELNGTISLEESGERGAQFLIRIPV